MATRAIESSQPPSVLAEHEFEGCLGVIVLTKDQVIPSTAQDGLLNASGRSWLTQRMACSHSAPFIERCDELAGIVEEMTEAFESKLESLWEVAKQNQDL